MSLTNKYATEDDTGPTGAAPAKAASPERNTPPLAHRRFRASVKLFTRKLLPLFMSLAMIVGTLPMFTATAFADAESNPDITTAVKNFLSVYPARINAYLAAHTDDFSYNDFFTFLMGTYDPDSPYLGSGVLAAVSVINFGYGNVSDDQRSEIDSTLTGLVKSIAEKSPSGKLLIEAVLKVMLDNEPKIPKEGDVYERLNYLWGAGSNYMNNNNPGRYLQLFAVFLNAFRQTYVKANGSKPASTRPYSWSFTDNDTETGMSGLIEANVNLDAAFGAIDKVDFSAYTDFLADDITLTAITDLLGALPDDLETLEPLFAALDAFSTFDVGGIGDRAGTSALSIFFNGDAENMDSVPEWNTADMVTDVLIDGLLAEKNPEIALVLRAYVDDARETGQTSTERWAVFEQALANVSTDITAIASGNPQSAKRALLNILKSLNILKLDSSGIITDVDLDKLMGFFGVEEDGIKNVLSGLITSTVETLDELANLLKDGDDLSLEELDVRAQRIIAGLKKVIAQVDNILPKDDELWTPIREKLDDVDDALTGALKLAKGIITDLLKKADGRDYTWLETHLDDVAALLNPATSEKRINAILAYTLNGQPLSSYADADDIKLAREILFFIHSKLEVRGIDFTYFNFTGPENNPVTKLHNLLNGYLGLAGNSTADVKARITRKTKTVIGLLNTPEFGNITPDDIAGFIADTAKDYLKDNNRLGFIFDNMTDDALKALVLDLVFNDEKPNPDNLSDVGLTLTASLYKKAAGFVNKTLDDDKNGELRRKLNSLASLTAGLYNNIAYVGRYIDEKDRVTITADLEENPVAKAFETHAVVTGGVEYATLSTDYDTLLFGPGDTGASAGGYAAFLEKLGFTFGYEVSNVTRLADETVTIDTDVTDLNPFAIAVDDSEAMPVYTIVGTGNEVAGASYDITVQAKAYFKYHEPVHNYSFTFADTTYNPDRVIIAVPALDASFAEEPEIIKESWNDPDTVGGVSPYTYIHGDTDVTPLSVEVSLEIDDPSGLTYQWYSNTLDQIAGGTPITDATNATYIPPATTPGAYYYVVVRNTKDDASNPDDINYKEVTSTVAKITVLEQSHGIILNVASHTFNSVTEGYTESPDPLTVTVTNTGNRPTGDLKITLGGKDPSAFTAVDSDTGNSITTVSSIGMAPLYGTFGVKPSAGLSAETYEAVITLTGENGIT
jgi:hypothetical protein